MEIQHLTRNKSQAVAAATLIHARAPRYNAGPSFVNYGNMGHRRGHRFFQRGITSTGVNRIWHGSQKKPQHSRAPSYSSEISFVSYGNMSHRRGPSLGDTLRVSNFKRSGLHFVSGGGGGVSPDPLEVNAAIPTGAMPPHDVYEGVMTTDPTQRFGNDPFVDVEAYWCFKPKDGDRKQQPQYQILLIA
ncbi:unnamed protein product [Fusarium venenatum]|uniref:Uncharacterized protein n=1 Tax=Fusarium venenatum TaxID=56646 RepID=A0A2L2TC16_9HYPO|nr:uncharacterized protein FVRRES_04932 [Fusarium venenatum]CEI60496.1 unnamed protein product [Fusarium venenatum]